MSLYQSGGRSHLVWAHCLTNLEASGLSFVAGKNYEVVVDLGAMLVVKVKSSTGSVVEAVVPKTGFQLQDSET
jgi:hypothetical protein